MEPNPSDLAMFLYIGLLLGALLGFLLGMLIFRQPKITYIKPVQDPADWWKNGPQEQE